MADRKTLQTEHVRWDLSVLYSGIDDPQIDADIKKLVALMRNFHDAYTGKLDETLGDAIAAYADIDMLDHKIGHYLFLRNALNTNDAAVKGKLAEVERILSEALAHYLTFFDLEIAALSDESIEKAMAHPVAKKHRPWIDQIRILKPYMLSEPVEGALTKRSPFGAGSWAHFFDELDADLEFAWKGEKKTLPEMTHMISESKDASERADALAIIHEGLKGTFAKYSAETLYMVAGSAAVERRDRGFKHPMHARNLSNRVPDSVVDALHKAVKDVAAPLAQRYYRLKAAHLGQKTLAWSDRNAPMPFADTSNIPFNEAMDMVFKAYAEFSPTLAKLVKDSRDTKRIDAPATKGKHGGAFNASHVLPGNVPMSWTLLNYLGAARDVMTLAHESGHGVHGLLAGETQGPLMFHAPIAYCEVASVFGEMVAFEFLKKRLKAEGKKEALLALIMNKIDDMVNTTVRQISFSNFERRLHGMDETYSTWSEPRKHSLEALSAIWKQVTEELYGKNGDVFIYENIDLLWSYVPHFHTPFYVYGYAFGEFFTQSLYAKRHEFGDRFEPLYLDLLRSGSTKNVLELMQPFGLDPTSETFWKDGIRAGLGTMIEEAEASSQEMGVHI